MAKAKHKRKRKRKNRVPLLLIIAFLLVGVSYAAIHVLFAEPKIKTEPLPKPVVGTLNNDGTSHSEPQTDTQDTHTERKESFYTILLSGVDDGNGGSDTNILLAVDAKNDSIYGVSIPRDTKAIVNGRACKINAAYNIGGMELMAEVVSNQLGIPVDYTILVDLKGFKQLVDAIGGVQFYVPVNMYYDDPVQNLSIHFSKGMQHLTGAEALKVVRFRHNNDGTGYGNEDIGRMQTQQNFLKAVAKQTLTLSNLNKVDNFVKIFQQNVETDLTLGNLAWLGKEVIGMGVDALEFSTLPGNWKSPYIYLDKDETLTLVNTYLNPYVEDRTAKDLNIP